MSEPTILAIDMGTQSARALLFDLQGNLLAKGQQKIEPYYSVAPGWAEQDPEVFWQAICAACQKLWQQPGVDKTRIRGVGLTTQRATVLNLDRNLRPLRPAIVWMDQRRTQGLKPIGGLWGLAFRLSGMTATVRYLQAEAEASHPSARNLGPNSQVRVALGLPDLPSGGGSDGFDRLSGGLFAF